MLYTPGHDQNNQLVTSTSNTTLPKRQFVNNLLMGARNHQSLRFCNQIGQCAGLSEKFVLPNNGPWVENVPYPIGQFLRLQRELVHCTGELFLAGKVFSIQSKQHLDECLQGVLYNGGGVDEINSLDDTPVMRIVRPSAS